MSSKNPLKGWRIDSAKMTCVGEGLNRPECVLATIYGVLWIADGRGGVVRMNSDGRQEIIMPSAASTDAARPRVPNGIALMPDGRVMIANLAGSAIEAIAPDGTLETLVTRIEGRSLGQTNFVLRDHRDRYWITVSSESEDPFDGFKRGHSSGYVALLDRDGARIVADGFANTNEVRLDDKGELLYIVETGGRCIWRMRVAEDGSLSHRQRFGPTSLGAGFPDGIAFDTFGNLWCTMFLSERVIAITPDGELLELLDLGDPKVNEEADDRYAAGTFDGAFITQALVKAKAKLLASITFGGSDLRTVFLGTIAGTTLPSFQSPVAGRCLAHWM
jgi:gluconolactonase